MRVEEFVYTLPKRLIAQAPTPVRGESRLMVLLRDAVRHERFSDLPNYLGRRDVLVLNDTKVIRAKLVGRRETGGRVELLLVRRDGQNWVCLGKGRVREGERILIGDSSVDILRKSGGRLLVRFHTTDFESFLKGHGQMPVPPYIKKRLEEEDRYQTVYATVEGSVAAPTAGLHFTDEILQRLESKGVRTVKITLHIGPGTFLPVRSEKVENHVMEEEYFEISEGAAMTINQALDDGRLIVVGTTAVRALESSQANGRVRPSRGWTDLFIYPPYEFRIGMDALITNFHLPRSTVLMLVSAYAGRERILRAYEVAIEREYRFYSFGDSMLIFR